MTRVYSIGILVGVILFSGCQRSPAYRAEQGYYNQDTEYTSKRASRFERFGQPKKRIFVLPFVNATPLGGDELGEFSAVELLREIRSSGKAIVPEDLRSADTSRDFYAGDKVRLSSLVREGKKMGVAILAIGKIKKITYRTKGDEVGLFRQKKSIAVTDLEMRLFDVSNGKEILFDEKSPDSQSSQMSLFGGENEDPKSVRNEIVHMSLRNGMKMYALDIVRALEKISWEGRIAKISNGRVYINAGRSTGINVGDILKVLSPGEDIYDPVTGTYMGRSQGQVKGTLEVTDFMGGDGSVAVVHSGGNFLENDAVQLY